jgi:hypothetical protein
LRRAILLAGLHPARDPQRRIVEVVDQPHASQGYNSGKKYVGERLDKHAKQACKCGQYCCTCFQQLSACSEKHPDHASQDQDQQKLLPQRPLLPWHGHELADLIDGPSPDQLDEMKDRSNALLQEFQQLIENLFHGRGSRISTVE